MLAGLLQVRYGFRLPIAFHEAYARTLMASARLLGVRHRRSLYDVTGAPTRYFNGLQVMSASRAAIVLALKAVSQ